MMVLPSLHEGIPVSLMEAMAYGVPVISTAVGGTPELLHNGAGILAPPQDPVALADAMERLVRSPELRRQLGQAGRRRVEEEFSLSQTCCQFMKRIEAAGRPAAIARYPNRPWIRHVPRRLSPTAPRDSTITIAQAPLRVAGRSARIQEGRVIRPIGPIDRDYTISSARYARS